VPDVCTFGRCSLASDSLRVSTTAPRGESRLHVDVRQPKDADDADPHHGVDDGMRDVPFRLHQACTVGRQHSSDAAGDEAPPAPPPALAESGPVPAPAAPALTEDELFARKTLEELNAERPLGDAFFDVDQASIKEDARAVLQTNAEWLRRWPSTRVAIEDHFDPRGTNEYNLALGQRRANAVRDYLVSLGIEANRLIASSRGEESLVCFAENEECWRQNRRGHSIITAK